MDIVVVFAAPVPVGHRVELTWYQKVERGLVPGQVRTDQREYQPRIVDLDTGIVYECDWAVGHGGRAVPDTPHEISDTLLDGFHELRTVKGVVRACRVVTIRSIRDYDVQTHLVVEEST